MSQAMPSGAATRSTAPCDPAARVARSLLGYGVIAGPVYVLVAGVQEATRAGFDPTRDDVSLLANGSTGWVQIANFVVVGLMVIAAAIGARRVLAGERGGVWGPILLAGYGAGLVAAGAFTADPAYGFPAGTPAGPQPMSWHGAAHLGCAAVGFVSLIAACLVFAGRFGGLGRRGWAAYSVVTGVVFGAGFVGVATGSGSVPVTLAFTAAVLVAWAWVTAISLHLYRHAAVAGGAR